MQLLETPPIRPRYSDIPPVLGRELWVPTTEEEYTEMLGVVPPRHMSGGAFLVGEPVCDRNCAVRGTYSVTYDGYAQFNKTYYKVAHEITLAEFKSLCADFRPE